MEILKYKEFEGSAEVDMTRNVCRGKILFIDDLVTYESKSVSGLQKQFEDAVDDYIETCRQIGKLAERSCRGQFNVRVGSELHRGAVRRAALENISLNEFVSRALKCYLVPVSTGGVSAVVGAANRFRLDSVSLASSYELSIDKFQKQGTEDRQTNPIFLGANGNAIDLTQSERGQSYVN